MRHRGWIALLGTFAVLLQTPGVRAGGGKEEGHPESQKQQVSTCIKQRAWMAYFRDEKGEESPVRDTENTAHDQDWMGLRFTDYDGPRIRLGVLKVYNNAAHAEGQVGGERLEVPVTGIQELVTVALYKTKRFDVIEQQRIAEVLHEQLRSDVVEPSPSNVSNVGKVLRAQYLVYGTVNEWTPKRGKSSFGPFSFLRTGKTESEVAITFTLADVATGQILYTTLQRARLTGAWSVSWNESHAGSGSTSEKTPIDYTVTACANKAAFEIARFLRDRKWKGTVVKIEKPDVFVNAGSQAGMAPQTRLNVMAVKGIIRDGETILGEDLRGIGTLEVMAVQSGFSVARIVDGCRKMAVGDRVELATAPAPTPEPPECAALDPSLDR